MKTREIKTTSYKEVCEEAGLTFIKIVNSKEELKSNEYFALMVTDWVNKLDNPHVKGYDYRTGDYLVGVEKPGGKYLAYISKNYYSRKNSYRGRTIVVRVKDKSKYSILT